MIAQSLNSAELCAGANKFDTFDWRPTPTPPHHMSNNPFITHKFFCSKCKGSPATAHTEQIKTSHPGRANGGRLPQFTTLPFDVTILQQMDGNPLKRARSRAEKRFNAGARNERGCNDRRTQGAVGSSVARL
jgi:hypothetical protein